MKLRTWCIRIGHILTKTVLVFTGFLVFLTLFCPQLTKAENDRGGITIRHQNVPIEKVFQSIEKQSGYRFFYNETLLQGAGKVTLNLQNVSLQEALEACFRNQPLSYAIVEKTIIVKKRPEQQSAAPIATAAATFSKPGKIIAVRGKVTSNNTPIVGASIMIKGTDNGASTDKDGMFTLPEVEDDATLVISSVSHTMREVKLTGQTYIAIDLSKQTDDLDEAVVVAYNTTTQRKNVGAVTVVRGEQIQNMPNRSFDKSLQGLVPGLLVTSGTGQPGGGVSNMVLRGIATGTDAISGSTVRNPLIVIDGIPVYQDHIQLNISVNSTPISNPLSQLNPSDIETITILKDAAAIALYGSKASNGVILVTTKKGRSGKTQFKFHHQTDIASRLKGKTEVLDQQEYLDLLFETYKNTNSAIWNDKTIRNDLFLKFPYRISGNQDTSFYQSPNWYKELYTNDATTINNDFSMSGGNDKSRYYLNLEYSNQNGIAKKTGYDRTSIRFNFENNPANWLKLGFNTAISYNKQDYSAYTDGTIAIGLASVMSPLNPVRLDDGNYMLNYKYGSTQSASAQVANPVASSEYNINRNSSYRGLSKAFAEVSLLKHLKIVSNVGVDFMLTENKEKTDPRLAAYGFSLTPGTGSIRERDLRRANIITTNVLRYARPIREDHSVELMLGQEAQILNQRTMLVEVRNLRIPDFDQLSNGTTLRTGTGTYSKETLFSLFGQANYNYKNKYFLTTSIRQDGSSKFGERRRFGNYWSTGAGWQLTEEQFMKNLLWIDYLKIRGSIGVAGNSAAITALTRYDQLNLSSYSGNTAVYPADQPGNPDIKWEQTFTWDAGLEARFFKERIGVTADFYKRNTTDLIYTINLPGQSGYGSVLGNIGDMENKGIELSITADILRLKEFKWTLSMNWSTNQNKLIKANVPLAASIAGQLANKEGENFNSFYLVRWAGVDPTDGRPIWLNEQGDTTKSYNLNNRVIVGKPQPDGYGSITSTWVYRNFTVSALFYYQYGFQVYNGSYAFPLLTDGKYPYVNQTKEALDYWKKPGDVTANPRRQLNNTDGGDLASTRYLSNGDYLRLKTVLISYSIPKRITDQIHLNTINVYVQGSNLALWTKNKSLDPDNVNVGGNVEFPYPNQRSFSFGVNVSF